MGIEISGFEDLKSENKFLKTTIKHTDKILKNLENEVVKLKKENEILQLESKLINAILYQDCIEITITSEDDKTHIKATFQKQNTPSNDKSKDIGDLLGLK